MATPGVPQMLRPTPLSKVVAMPRGLQQFEEARAISPRLPNNLVSCVKACGRWQGHASYRAGHHAKLRCICVPRSVCRHCAARLDMNAQERTSWLAAPGQRSSPRTAAHAPSAMRKVPQGLLCCSRSHVGTERSTSPATRARHRKPTD